MAASVITRVTWTDDDGTGTTGTIINNARLGSDIYDKIDQLMSGTGSYTTLELGGILKVDGVLDVAAGYKETKSDITISTNTITLDLAAASLFSISTVNANITTTTLNNKPASGRYSSFVIRGKGDGTARTWAWFDAAKWTGGVIPTRTSTNNKWDWYLFVSVDAWVTYSGFVLGTNMDN
jgi:hypothetical protein